MTQGFRKFDGVEYPKTDRQEDAIARFIAKGCNAGEMIRYIKFIYTAPFQFMDGAEYVRTPNGFKKVSA